MNDNGENQDVVLEKPGGLEGAPHVFSEHRTTGRLKYLRADARLVARILSCGAVEPEQMREMMRGMFAMAVEELAKPAELRQARNISALLRIFEVGAKLELETVKHADAPDRDRDVNVNVGVGVQVGRLPVAEIVVNDRDEARQFADIRQRLLEAAGGNGEETE